jgi:hypothetical protein
METVWRLLLPFEAGCRAALAIGLAIRTSEPDANFIEMIGVLCCPVSHRKPPFVVGLLLRLLENVDSANGSKQLALYTRHAIERHPNNYMG